MSNGSGGGMSDHDFAKEVRETLGAESNEDALRILGESGEELDSLRAAAAAQPVAVQPASTLEAPPVSTDPNDAPPQPKTVNPADLPAE